MWKPEEDWQHLSQQAWDDLFKPGIATEQIDEGESTGGGSLPPSEVHTCRVLLSAFCLPIGTQHGQGCDSEHGKHVLAVEESYRRTSHEMP